VPMNCDWKLVHYLGKARPNLYDKYIPVQIRRPDGVPPAIEGEPTCNYGAGLSIAHEFAVGSADGEGPPTSWVLSWMPAAQLAQTERDYAKELQDAPPAAVPKGYVLMAGDNRNNSYDGRCWGLVPREDVIGRSEFIWLPFSRWRVTR